MPKIKNKKLSSILEDCLETIYVIIEEENKPIARVTDIARKLKVNKANVTNNMKLLCEQGYVNYSSYQGITLTRKGSMLAKKIFNRHNDLIIFFQDILGLENKIAEENACRVEHSIDNKSINRLKDFVKFIKTQHNLKYNKKTKMFQCLKVI